MNNIRAKLSIWWPTVLILLCHGTLFTMTRLFSLFVNLLTSVFVPCFCYEAHRSEVSRILLLFFAPPVSLLPPRTGLPALWAGTLHFLLQILDEFVFSIVPPILRIGYDCYAFCVFVVDCLKFAGFVTFGSFVAWGGRWSPTRCLRRLLLKLYFKTWGRLWVPRACR